MYSSGAGCAETFDVHRLECHAPRCKAAKRPPLAGAYPFKCQNCAQRFKSSSGLSKHERHRHHELANQRCINAGRREAKRKRKLRRVVRVRTDLEAAEPQKPPLMISLEEAPKLKTQWDELAMGIFVDLFCQHGDGKGLHKLVRATLGKKGYEFSLKQILSKKRTKGFQRAVVEGNPRQTGDTEDERKACGESNTVTGGDGTTRSRCTGRPEVQGDLRYTLTY